MRDIAAMKLPPDKYPGLIRFLEELLELCGVLNVAALSNSYGHQRHVCLQDLDAVLSPLADSIGGTDWKAILEGLERWEDAWQPLLVLIAPMTRPSRLLREARPEFM